MSILIAILLASSAGAPGSKAVGAAPASARSPGPVKQAPAPITQAPVPVKQAPAAGKPAAAEKSAVKVPTVDEIFAAMRRREEAIKSFELVWRVYTIMGAEAADKNAAIVLGKEGRGTGAGKPLIANWVPGRVVVSGTKFRWESSSIVFRKNAVGSTDAFIEAFNGNLDQGYQPKSWSRNVGAAALTARKPFGKSNVIVATPYAILRPFSQEIIPFEPSAATVEPRAVSVNGCQCILLRCRQTSFDVAKEWRCYLDPQRGYVPVRIENDRSGRLARETNIREFAMDPQFGPVPKEWSTVVYAPSGTVHSQYFVSVSEYHLNRDVPDSEFNLIFPEGTQVTDRRENGKRFVVDAAGKIVPATADWKPLDSSAAGRWGLIRTLVVCNGVGLLLVLAIVFYRRRRAGA